MKLGIVTHSLTNLNEGGAERHVKEFIRNARNAFELYLFPTLDTYLQIQDEQDQRLLIQRVKDLEKEGISVVSSFYSILEWKISKKDRLVNFLDFRLFRRLARVIRICQKWTFSFRLTSSRQMLCLWPKVLGKKIWHPNQWVCGASSYGPTLVFEV